MKFDKQDVITKLRDGICVAKFTKKNGEQRVMSCTLNEQILPTAPEGEGKKKPNPDVLSVWDTEVNQWRSFRWDSLSQFHMSSKL